MGIQNDDYKNCVLIMEKFTTIVQIEPLACIRWVDDMFSTPRSLMIFNKEAKTTCISQGQQYLRATILLTFISQYVHCLPKFR